MATYALRGIQGLSRILDVGKKTFTSTLRCASTQNKIKTGPKGEKIILSEFPDVSYPETLLHEFVWSNSESYQNHIALECGVSGKKYTYAQAKDATSYIGRSLRNMGLKSNDVVALIAPNFPDTILSLLGGISGGLIITPMNPLYTAEEMAKQMLKINVKAVITSTAIALTALAATKACLPSGTPFIVIDDETGTVPEGLIPFDDLITRGKSLPPVKLDAICDDTAIVPFSSGTTGLPKGVVLTHRNLVSNIIMAHYSSPDLLHPTTDTYQERIPALLPFFHIYGMNSVAFSRLHFGAKIITIPKFAPQLFLDVLEKSKATSLFLVPPLVIFLSNSPLAKKKHFEHLHLVMSGAAPLAKSDIDKLVDKFDIDTNVVNICQGYGLTESSPVAFLERGKKFSSIGKNIANCEARLVDIETQQDICTPGQNGELLIRGPHIMKGYFNDDASTKATLTEDKWLKTGDLAYFDEDLDFFIADRMKELIKVKGFQVPPAELEGLLRSHPDVEEAAVIGIPHARHGEVPRAFVVVKKDKKLTEDDIKNFMKGKVSEFKELRGGVAFINELPKSVTGKILRSKLKSEFKS